MIGYTNKTEAAALAHTVVTRLHARLAADL